MINFKNDTDLFPAIVQDATTSKVLMLGYMNREAWERTLSTKKVTFYSRSKKRLWVKGETSGNFLHLTDIKTDCDRDAILIKANPAGPVCHTGNDTCWNEKNENAFGFLSALEQVIEQRKQNPSDDSYTSKLLQKGVNKVAQKVGEEAVELVIEAKDDNNELFLNEAADLLFHYLVLLHAKGVELKNVTEILEKRHKK